MKKIKKKNEKPKSNLLISQEQNQFINHKSYNSIESNIQNKKDIKSNNNISKCLLYIFILENIFLLFYFIIQIVLYTKKNYFNKTIKILNREKALDSGLPFVKKCLEGILINKIKFTEKVKNPLISVVIPCYNCEQHIKSSVRSIQNQDMKEVEIIIVNDFSNQETINAINVLKNEDPRIEIVNNIKREGLLYSRSIGALRTRGKYIITLDSDDIFLDHDVFDALYISAEDGNFDIISHRIFEAFAQLDRDKIKEHMFNYKPNNLTVFQPELSCYAISNNENENIKMNDINIWGKLFRATVYKSAVNIIGEEKLRNSVIHEEDISMLFIITNVASSYKYIRKYCLFHNIHKKSTSSQLSHDEKVYGRLFRLEVELDLAKKDCYNIPALNLIKLQKKYDFVKEERNILYLKKIIKKIMYSEKIDDKYKDEIKSLYSDYLKDNNNINNYTIGNDNDKNHNIINDNNNHHNNNTHNNNNNLNNTKINR